MMCFFFLSFLTSVRERERNMNVKRLRGTSIQIYCGINHADRRGAGVLRTGRARFVERGHECLFSFFFFNS